MVLTLARFSRCHSEEEVCGKRINAEQLWRGVGGVLRRRQVVESNR
jgi:hypothetical protein